MNEATIKHIWKEAPPKAEYLAMNKDKTWWFHSVEPVLLGDVWYCWPQERWPVYHSIKPEADYVQSLYKRPGERSELRMSGAKTNVY